MNRKYFWLVTLPLFFALLLMGIWFTQVLYAPMAVGQEDYYLFKPGSTVSHLANDLYGKQYIHRRTPLVAYAQLKGISNKLQAGEYRLLPGMSLVNLLDKMVQGEVVLHRLTLVEGWNLRQVLQALQRNDVLLKQLDYTQAPLQLATQLGFPDHHPEGRFFPDTYAFSRGTSDIQFLQRAWRRMDVLLEREWPQRQTHLPLNSPYEALILASIVEKETAQADERGRIAAVFINRLRKGMRLQTDPTVIYGLGEAYDGDIKFRDLRTDTPYNTYTRSGLPPTPIAMPGLDALRAALNPEDSDMLFFVARGDGSHYFSTNLAEHEQAVTRYQRKKRRHKER